MATALRTMATVSTTREVKLTAIQTITLRQELQRYAKLVAEEKAAKKARKASGAKIGKIREKTGEQSLTFEDFKITEVRGYTSKLDKAKLVELGCAMAWIEEATTTKPKKAYEKITCPGDSDDEGDE